MLPIGLPGAAVPPAAGQPVGLLPDGASAPRRPASRSSPPATSARARARRRGCCAWSTTSSWPAWWAWCWPTTPTPSW
ncbi:MAG: hypothetical protein MZW92_34560 [Comamonadaceae bacterium]|nr:hypothetical protein [Comamonadaceae bacterium]